MRDSIFEHAPTESGRGHLSSDTSTQHVGTRVYHSTHLSSMSEWASIFLRNHTAWGWGCLSSWATTQYAGEGVYLSTHSHSMRVRVCILLIFSRGIWVRQSIFMPIHTAWAWGCPCFYASTPQVRERICFLAYPHSLWLGKSVFLFIYTRPSHVQVSFRTDELFETIFPTNGTVWTVLLNELNWFDNLH